MTLTTPCRLSPTIRSCFLRTGSANPTELKRLSHRLGIGLDFASSKIGQEGSECGLASLSALISWGSLPASSFFR